MIDYDYIETGGNIETPDSINLPRIVLAELDKTKEIIEKLVSIRRQKAKQVEDDGFEALLDLGIKWGNGLVHIPQRLQILILSTVIEAYEHDAKELAETIRRHFISEPREEVS